jgi:hypothetical protein
VTASDEHGMVEVTVDAQGVLVHLGLGPRVQQVEPDAVAEAIMTTLRKARRQLALRAEEIVTRTTGEDSPAVRALAAQVGQRLRETTPGPTSHQQFAADQPETSRLGLVTQQETMRALMEQVGPVTLRPDARHPATVPSPTRSPRTSSPCQARRRWPGAADGPSPSWADTLPARCGVRMSLRQRQI